MQLIVKLLKKSFYGGNIRKDIDGNIACKSKAWMMSEYDERVKDYWKASGMKYIVKMIHDAGLEAGVKKINSMSLHLGAFVLSNSKRIMNNLYTLLTDFIQKMSITQTLIVYILRTNIGINYIKLVWLVRSCYKEKMIITKEEYSMDYS